MPKYGDKTAKALDNYLKGYKLPTGTTRSGLVAPIKDLQRNYNTMKTMNLNPSDHFFFIAKQIMKQLLAVVMVLLLRPELDIFVSWLIH